MRIPSELWVKAHLRRLSGEGVFAAIVRKGDADFGSIWLKVNLLEGQARLYGPAPEPLDADDPARRWLAMHKTDTIPDAEADARVAKARAMDSDLWLIEIEDRQGRHGLDDQLVEG